MRKQRGILRVLVSGVLTGAGLVLSGLSGLTASASAVAVAGVGAILAHPPPRNPSTEADRALS